MTHTIQVNSKSGKVRHERTLHNGHFHCSNIYRLQRLINEHVLINALFRIYHNRFILFSRRSILCTKMHNVLACLVHLIFYWNSLHKQVADKLDTSTLQRTSWRIVCRHTTLRRTLFQILFIKCCNFCAHRERDAVLYQSEKHTGGLQGRETSWHPPTLAARFLYVVWFWRFLQFFPSLFPSWRREYYHQIRQFSLRGTLFRSLQQRNTISVSSYIFI